MRQTRVTPGASRSVGKSVVIPGPSAADSAPVEPVVDASVATEHVLVAVRPEPTAAEDLDAIRGAFEG
ncbi:hypothetical protein ACFQE1_08520 [Halobium palmae]|uniref:Uncharacterized protein n=1 Tax=Halobium palmae TaxID=1776492 RepID=A0ABD5RYM1_9EURY